MRMNEWKVAQPPTDSSRFTLCWWTDETTATSDGSSTIIPDQIPQSAFTLSACVLPVFRLPEGANVSVWTSLLMFEGLKKAGVEERISQQIHKPAGAGKNRLVSKILLGLSSRC